MPSRHCRKLPTSTSANASTMTISKVPTAPLPIVGLTCNGDLWRMGPHLLLCGDSTDPDTVLRFMNGELADLVVTDPPYGVSYVGKRTARRPIANDGLIGDDLRHFLARAFSAWPLKPGGSYYVCAPPEPPNPNSGWHSTMQDCSCASCWHG